MSRTIFAFLRIFFTIRLAILQDVLYIYFEVIRLTTGQRIKDRRKAIDISAEKLAEMLGVSPATIYRYENGDIEKIPGDRLGPIATALRTTPAYLMGWVDSAEPIHSSTSLSQEEELLIHKYRCLDDRGKAAVLNTLDYEYRSLPGEKANSLAKEA